MKEASLICEIIVVLVQMFHTYWIMEYGSGLKDKSSLGSISINPKAIQSWLFCGVIDIAFVFAMINRMYFYAFGFIAILTVINLLYVYNTVEDMKDNKTYAEKHTSKRRQLVRYFNVLIINACMILFAHIYTTFQ